MIITGVQNLNLGYLGKVENRNGIDIRKVIDLYKEEPVTIGYEPNITEPHTTLEVKGEYYYVFSDIQNIRVYKKLPLVRNDGKYNWRETFISRLGKLYRAEIWRGFLQFSITYRLRDDVVDIQIYEKYGRGTHRHLDAIWIDNGNNESIEKAISGWVEKFKERVNAI